MKNILFGFFLLLSVYYSANVQWTPAGYNETMGMMDLHFLNGNVGFSYIWDFTYCWWCLN